MKNSTLLEPYYFILFIHVGWKFEKYRYRIVQTPDKMFGSGKSDNLSGMIGMLAKEVSWNKIKIQL